MLVIFVFSVCGVVVWKNDSTGRAPLDFSFESKPRGTSKTCMEVCVVVYGVSDVVRVPQNMWQGGEVVDGRLLGEEEREEDANAHDERGDAPLRDAARDSCPALKGLFVFTENGEAALTLTISIDFRL